MSGVFCREELVVALPTLAQAMQAMHSAHMASLSAATTTTATATATASSGGGARVMDDSRAERESQDEIDAEQMDALRRIGMAPERLPELKHALRTFKDDGQIMFMFRALITLESLVLEEKISKKTGNPMPAEMQDLQQKLEQQLRLAATNPHHCCTNHGHDHAHGPGTCSHGHGAPPPQPPVSTTTATGAPQTMTMAASVPPATTTSPCATCPSRTGSATDSTPTTTASASARKPDTPSQLTMSL
ncbi:hypothetical protein Pelo_17701 [Pelomyxa schiedti]|nr:hypothetical protein Pelo_17701 [Pelomyxa schiedti]